ncbi:MAG TPA: anthranilate phosphoribosyltransferase [Flavobacteriales bacterium]|nr:anthranilate phosphoribosyltransferase [Flavobacteriales bacterium]
MRKELEYLFDHKTLSKSKAKELLVNIAKGTYNPSQLASFLTVFIMRSITVEELEGFRDALLELCLKIDLSEFDTVDLCGTGGDGKDTFNISTISSFIVAGAGIKVAKHGNYGVSSSCGSSNVIQHLGYEFTNDEDKLKRQIETAGICFLHAPLFHPAMKNIAPIRKEMGVKTFFNMLGPMVNPSSPKNQLVGVFNLELARLYSYLYQTSGKQYVILHTLDGYDEISLTADFKMITNEGEFLLTPNDLGLRQLKLEDLYGGSTIEAAATVFVKILEGQGTDAQIEVVTANAGMAIHCVKPNISIVDCIEMAKESIISGSALDSLNKLLKNG